MTLTNSRAYANLYNRKETMNKQDKKDLDELITAIVEEHRANGLIEPNSSILAKYGITLNTLSEFIFDRIVRRYLEKVHYESKKEESS
jgi:hypothetical protein